MNYGFTAIPDDEVPRADRSLQHLLDTYASETNKVFSLWMSLRPEQADFKPHERSSTVYEILKHQLLSERRFFGEFLGAPEPDAAEVLPSGNDPAVFARRLVELARPRLDFLAAQPLAWWYENVRFFDVERERIWIFWRRVLHTAHHRTQLSVYQRLLGEKVLPVYGPTADVSWTGADPTVTVQSAQR
jgi:uncharacterized damage-inducible protein DinB